MKAALLIVDMQKGCREPKSKESLKSAAEQINRTSAMFREKGLPVIVIQDVTVGKGPGSKKFEVLDDVNTAETDIFIQKSQLNAFWQTGLDETLRGLGTDFVVVSGFSADYCVLSTYFGAAERGYTAVVLQNGVAASDESGVIYIQSRQPVICHKALEYFLNSK